jgi:hypothetical protein
LDSFGWGRDCREKKEKEYEYSVQKCQEKKTCQKKKRREYEKKAYFDPCSLTTTRVPD